MKLKSILIMVALLLPIISACNKVDGDKGGGYKSAAVNKTFNTDGSPLIFKGLYLRMPFGEFKEKSDRKVIPWKLREDEKSIIDYIGDEGWIGYEGEGNNRKYYDIFLTYLNWYDDRIVGINISSNSVTADYIDTYVKSWMRFAVAELEKKYGSPTRIIIPVEKLSILDFKAHFAAYCYKWENMSERITVSAGQGASEYYCLISFEDIDGIDRLENSKKKNPKSSF